MIGCNQNVKSEGGERVKPSASAPVNFNVSQEKENTRIILEKKTEKARKLEIDDSNNSILRKTHWIPNRGVDLLSNEEAKRVWTDYNSKWVIKNHTIPEGVCWLPKLDDPSEHIIDHLVFSTPSAYIFVYNIDKQFRSFEKPVWSICEKETYKPAKYVWTEGAPDEDESPLSTGLDHSCGGWVTQARFRELDRNGALFLEVIRYRCQDNENHYELMFHLNKTEIKEVAGSRMDMDYKNHPYQPWRWWYDGEKYKPRQYKWSGDKVVWQRNLKKVIEGQFNRDRYPQVFVKRKCAYNTEVEEVICEEKITKSKPFKEEAYTLFLEREDVCERGKRKYTGCDKTLEEDMAELIEEGFDIEEKYTWHYMDDGRKFRDW